MDPKSLQRRFAAAQIGPMAVLLGVYFLLRLPHLRDQSVFCDEATYLRWAQMIAQDPRQYLFVSMQDAKLPLHYWLLALARPLSHDPVFAGRLLSVLFGALTIPAIFGLGAQLSALTRSPRLLAPFTAALMIVCPFVAMNQRLALAEPLVLLEAVVLAWQSLRLARHVQSSAAPRVLAADAILLGLIWGLALLTKQNFSYLLWTLPPTALLMTVSRATWWRGLRAFVPRYAVATVIGLGCFVPVLMTTHRWDLRTKLFYKQDFFSSSAHLGRWPLFTGNVLDTFWPYVNDRLHWWPYDPAMPLDRGILYLYLTPPILLLALAGALWMAARRQWTLLAFCGIWCLALLGTMLLTAHLIYSRYLLVGSFPFLILAAWCACTLLTAARARRPWPVAAACLVAIAFAWPALATTCAALDSQAPVLTADDRRQFIATFAAGGAAEQALVWLQSQAGQRPITVVTGTELGVRNDFTWLTLTGQPRVQLYCDDSTPPLRSTSSKADAFYAKTQQWGFDKERPVVPPADRPIYYLAECSENPKTATLDFMPLRFFGPGATLIQTFYNPPATAGRRVQSGIAIYRIPRPAPILEAAASPNP